MGVNSTITAIRRPLVANNMISIGTGTNAAIGIYEGNGTNTGSDYIYNSVLIGSSLVSNTNVAGCFLSTQTTVGAQSSIVNNIFAASNGAGLIRIDNITSYPTVNYNDYYSTGITNNFSNYVSTTQYTTLASWKAATSFDANTIIVNPNFFSSTNLRTVNNALIAGTPSALATTDINGQPRSVRSLPSEHLK